MVTELTSMRLPDSTRSDQIGRQQPPDAATTIG